MARGVPENCRVDLVVHTEDIPRDGRAGLGVQQLQRALFQLVQPNAVSSAKGRLLVHLQFFRAVMQQGRHPGLAHVRAIPYRQADCLLFRAQYVGDALVLEETQRHGPELFQRQSLQVLVRTVQLIPQDGAVYRRGQIIASAALRQLIPQVRGGDVHHAGDCERKDTGKGVRPIDPLPLNGKQLLRVLLRPAEGCDPRQSHNALRLMPCRKG
ncbi:hypothetical protein SDC9_113104 [bioreactor metagenome]|uniref:Uncharacterized protein n=1 Tax=bioreactor metagenome TaxID=1076179 RepID=A0A645BLT5_9ZZZZ